MKFLHAILSLSLIFIFSACQIEGGARQLPTGTAPPPTAAASVVAPTALPAAAAVRIGLLDEPASLLPYQRDTTVERIAAPVSELLFPAPLLALNYTYTTTGVLTTVPTFENGDIVLTTAQLYLDASGQITTTVTEAITEVQQLSVTYRWNPELRWADGTPLTAADSVFAFELARSGALGQDANAKLALLDRYEQIDEHTTRAVLKPDFTDPAYITSFWTPLPRHVLAEVDATQLLASDFARMPLAYGPYQLDEREAGSIRLERNPYSAAAPESAETIIFLFRDDVEMLRSAVAGGSVDVALLEQPTSELFSATQGDSNLMMSATPNPIWEHLDFNLDVPLLQDIRVRRAIAHGTDRQGMIATLLGNTGNPLDSWIVPGQWAAAPADQLTRYSYDPDTAKRLLDEAGVVDSNGDGLRETAGTTATLRLYTTDGSALRLAAAERFRADMAAIGLAIEIIALPSEQLYSAEGPLYRRQFELALFAWIASPDPRGWERWSCAGVPNEGNGWTGNNFSGWCFFEADKAIRTATTALDRGERATAYLRQQQLFTQELPVLPLFQRVSMLLGSPTLNGPRPDPTAPITWNIQQWRRN
jgi:peptide/nickel transport system substrate-binding protein